jgi:hypothetical protein
LVEEAERLGQAILSGSQGSYLDDDFGRLEAIRAFQAADSILQPFYGGIQIAEFAVKGGDIGVNGGGRAVIAHDIGLAVSFEEGLESVTVVVKGELTSAEIA